MIFLLFLTWLIYYCIKGVIVKETKSILIINMVSLAKKGKLVNISGFIDIEIKSSDGDEVKIKI